MLPDDFYIRRNAYWLLNIDYETGNQLMELSVILGSGLLAAIVSAWVSRVNAERKIYADNVTNERAKWRERIRQIVSEYPAASEEQRRKLEIELITRLNPYDPEDLKLLESLRESCTQSYGELAARAALLLKHDWDRAKDETKPITRRRINPVKRLTYEEYMTQLAHYRNKDELLAK